MSSRFTWSQIQQTNEYRGRWIALDNCKYDARTAQPVEGSVVDFDEDLVELCSRIQQGQTRHCAILFCDDAEGEPASARPPSVRPAAAARPYTH